MSKIKDVSAIVVPLILSGFIVLVAIVSYVVAGTGAEGSGGVALPNQVIPDSNTNETTAAAIIPGNSTSSPKIAAAPSGKSSSSPAATPPAISTEQSASSTPTTTPAPSAPSSPQTFGITTSPTPGTDNVFNVSAEAAAGESLKFFLSCPANVLATLQTDNDNYCNEMLPSDSYTPDSPAIVTFINGGSAAANVLIKVIGYSSAGIQENSWASTLSVPAYNEGTSGYAPLAFTNVQQSYTTGTDNPYLIMWKSVGFQSYQYGLVSLQNQAGTSFMSAFNGLSGPLYMSDLRTGSIMFSLSPTVPAGRYRFMAYDQSNNLLGESSYFNVADEIPNTPTVATLKVSVTGDGKTGSENIASGKSALLEWTSVGAAFCTGSSNNPSDSGLGSTLPPEGSYLTAPLWMQSNTYSITCQDTTGASRTSSFTWNTQ